MIRVILPAHLKTLAGVADDVLLDVKGEATLKTLLNEIEEKFPVLKGTIRDYATQQRRPLLRFFACEKDLSYESPDTPLPQEVISGKEPVFIIGAIAGG